MKQTSSIRRGLFRLGWILPLGIMMSSCGGGGGSVTTPPPPPPATDSLTQADVQMLVQAAAMSAQSDSMVIAVVDRLGRILAVYKEPSAPATTPGNFGVAIPSDELAVSLARTGAFFSNDQAPLSSRTVRFISGIHFPPGVMNTGERGTLRNREYKSRVHPGGGIERDGSPGDDDWWRLARFRYYHR